MEVIGQVGVRRGREKIFQQVGGDVRHAAGAPKGGDGQGERGVQDGEAGLDPVVLQPALGVLVLLVDDLEYLKTWEKVKEIMAQSFIASA